MSWESWSLKDYPGKTFWNVKVKHRKENYLLIGSSEFFLFAFHSFHIAWATIMFQFLASQGAEVWANSVKFAMCAESKSTESGFKTVSLCFKEIRSGKSLQWDVLSEEPHFIQPSIIKSCSSYQWCSLFSSSLSQRQTKSQTLYWLWENNSQLFSCLVSVGKSHCDRL